MVALITGMVLHSTGNAAQILFKANYNMLSPEAKQQVECLAENMYFEAAYEPKVGQIAVAFVTINRVKSGRFEHDICGVVKQKIQNV